MPISSLPGKSRPYRQLFIIHSIITLVCVIVAMQLNSPQDRAGFLISQGFFWLSFLSISFSVYLFFLKKNIALLISIIVFKWPILIYVVYKAAQIFEPNPAFMALGFTPFLLSSIIWAVLQKDR